MDLTLVYTAALSMLAGAVGSTVLWAVYGIPKIGKRIEAKEQELRALLAQKETEYGVKMLEFAEDFNAKVESKQAEIMEFYQTEKAELMERLAEMPAMLGVALTQPETQAAITAAISPAIEAIAPDLIEALVSKGAEVLGARGNMAKSMAKAGAENGIDIEGMLANISPEQMKAGLSALQSGGAMPAGLPFDIKTIMQTILGDAVKGMLPAKYKKLLPAGINPLQLLGGLGGGGGNGSGHGQGGYNPGLNGK